MKGIKTKILLGMSCTVAVSLVLLGVVSSFLNYSSTMETVQESLEGAAVIAAKRVSQELTAYANVAVET